MDAPCTYWLAGKRVNASSMPPICRSWIDCSEYADVSPTESEAVVISVASMRPKRISTVCARRGGMLRSAMCKRTRLTAANASSTTSTAPTAPAIQVASVRGGMPKKEVT